MVKKYFKQNFIFGVLFASGLVGIDTGMASDNPDPLSWVKKEDGVIILDFSEPANYTGTTYLRLGSGRQEVIFPGENDITAFFPKGFYKDTDFSNVLFRKGKSQYELIQLMDNSKSSVEEIRIYEKYLRNNALMRIGISPFEDLKVRMGRTDDGVISCYIFPYFNNGKLSFYIFVDEDWKKQLKFTNILWGDNFRDSTILHIKKFDFTDKNSFNDKSKGIYIENIGQDVDFFKMSPIRGGIVVGEVDSEILRKYFDYDYDETVKPTWVMYR